MYLENLGGKTHRTSWFIIFYAKEKINLMWSNTHKQILDHHHITIAWSFDKTIFQQFKICDKCFGCFVYIMEFFQRKFSDNNLCQFILFSIQSTD